MPIALFLIINQEDPVWKQRLEVVPNPEGPHFHAGMATLAGYVHHMFSLQARTGRTVIRQRLHSSSLEQHVEELRCANAILRSGTPPPSDQDRELQVAYRRLSKAEHGWHYLRQQLDAAREMLDERTHVIIHLEHHVKQQGLELEGRAATITDLEQQLQVPPAPAAPAAPAEPDTESDVNEE
jgi:TolA-binding protein